MNYLIYLLFSSIFFLDFLFIKVGAVNRVFALLPELLSILVILVIVIRFSVTKKILIQPKYVVIFFMFCLIVIIGVVSNATAPGAFIAGLRTYFKFIPFFLLPAVFDVTSNDFSKHLKFLLGLAALQVPISFYQRYIQFPNEQTGDVITGTLNHSGALSIYLVSCIAVLVGFYIKKRLNFPLLLIASLFIFSPTIINETKLTIIIIPLAILIPVLIGALNKNLNIKAIIPILCVASLLIGGFVSLYYQEKETREQSVINFFYSGDYISYLYKESTGNQTDEKVGKVDSYILPVKYLSNDISKLALGLGVGNVSLSFSKLLSGKYTEKYSHLHPTRTGVAILLWEVGGVGVLIVFLGCFFVLNDARFMSKENSLVGTISVGWVAVSIIFMISLAYTNVYSINVIVFLYAYITGYIAANRARLRYAPNQKKLIC